MARVKAVYRPSDYPGPVDEATRRDLDEMFGQLFPGVADPAIDERHDGLAIAALSPKLALNLAKLSGLIALELPWCERRDLRELAIQSVNVELRSHYSFKARRPNAEAAGVSAEMQDALAVWESSDLFSDEQRLVIEYAHAVAGNAASDELFGRVVERYGERGAVELTTVIAFWSFWALFLNATRPG
jgi:alkylhydroperoxidase family enzyme